MTPKAVLDAGRAERQSLWLNDRNGEPYRVQSGKGPAPAKNPVLFTGDYNACNDFIDDRVFRAMLRALADDEGWLHRFSIQIEPMLQDHWEDEPIHQQLAHAFRTLAEDDHGW